MSRQDGMNALDTMRHYLEEALVPGRQHAHDISISKWAAVAAAELAADLHRRFDDLEKRLNAN